MSVTYEEELETAKRFVRSVNPSLSESVVEATAIKVMKALPKRPVKSVTPTRKA